MEYKYVLFYTKFNNGGFKSRYKFFKSKEKIIDYIAFNKIALDNIIIYKKDDLFKLEEIENG